MSAFYFECPEKKLCINAHIWTKSKFMGMSIGVNLLGDITLTVGGIPNEEDTDADQQSMNDQDEAFVSTIPKEDDEDVSDYTIVESGSLNQCVVQTDGTNTSTNAATSFVEGSSLANDSQHKSKAVPAISSVMTDSVAPSSGSKRKYRTETYCISMPSAFARSILTEPWAELGGRVNIACLESGYSAPIVFHTKVPGRDRGGVLRLSLLPVPGKDRGGVLRFSLLPVYIHLEAFAL